MTRIAYFAAGILMGAVVPTLLWVDALKRWERTVDVAEAFAAVAKAASHEVEACYVRQGQEIARRQGL